MQTLKPRHLTKGDVIGLVAPSFPFPTSETSEYYKWYLKGIGEIEKMGFKIKEGKNLRKVRWWSGGTPQERAEDINLMFADHDVKAIIAHDGGNDCIRILEYLNFELIKKNPKPFIGFSNITNIHSALYAKIGLVGFHMGLLTYDLGWVWNYLKPDKKEQGIKYFYSALTSTHSLGLIKPITDWECWRKGKAAGILFGGNLSMLDSIAGTSYFPKISDLKGSVFFWELESSPSYRIERILTHLKYLGLLDVISGMIVGKLTDIKRTSWEGFTEPTLRELVLDNLQGYDFPVLAGVDFGHKIVQIPMPVGVKAEMDADKLMLDFLEPAVI